MVLPVPPEAAGITVALVAALRCALEWFLVPVSEQVSVEMVLSLERLVTDGAQIFPLITVCQSVLGQGRGVAKHLVAEVTLLGSGLAVTLEEAETALWRRLSQHVEEAGAGGGGPPAGLVTGGWAGRG